MSSVSSSTNSGNQGATAPTFSFDELVEPPPPVHLVSVDQTPVGVASMGDLLRQATAMMTPSVDGGGGAPVPSTPVSIAGAFASAVNTAETVPEPKLSAGENGDAQFAEMTVPGYSTDVERFVGDCLAMSQKSVNDQMKAAFAAAKPKGSGSKRKGQASLPNDPIENIPHGQRMDITTQFKRLSAQIASCKNDNDRALMIVILAKMCFRERAIRASSSKGHRSLSYFMFSLFHDEFPVYARALLPLFVEYGCVRDLDALIAHFLAVDMEMVNTAVRTYIKMIDADIRVVTQTEAYPEGRGLIASAGDTLTHSQLNAGFGKMADVVTKLVADGKTPQEISAKFPHIKGLTNAAKWMKRSGKHNSNHRSLIVHTALTPGGLPVAIKRGDKYLSFCDRLFRKIITTLTALSGVVETMMAAGNWKFDPSKMPAGATYKYRIAWLNEICGEQLPHGMDESGNRCPSDTDRVALRAKVQTAAVNGALKGASLDSTKFADAIWPKVGGYSGHISKSDRLVLHAQFMDLCQKLKDKLIADHEKQIADWKVAGSPANLQPIDPLNLISTIDVSGSMGEIMQYAIINGIIGAVISNLGRFFITFDSRPSLIKLRDGDIVDWIQQVKSSPWGGSTNMDAANDLCIKVMRDVRKAMPTFDGKIVHMIHTDAQFDPYFAGFASASASSGYYNRPHVDTHAAWMPFVDRMKKRFANNAFALPMTIFWNYRSQTRGFPAHGKYEGVRLAEGLSSGLMFEALSGKVTFKVDKSGAVVADVDPIETLITALAHPDFDAVTDTIYATATGLFAKAPILESSRIFWTGYAPKPKSADAAGGSSV
jgi:hypothetical protein